VKLNRKSKKKWYLRNGARGGSAAEKGRESEAMVVVDPWSRRRARPESTRTGTHVVDDEDERERERERCKKV
jgi:hypothetical protein